MSRNIIRTMAVCAAGLVMSASAQNSPNSTAGSSTDQLQPKSSSVLDSNRRFATGRMGHQETRVSQIMNAEVKSNQGQTLGNISDLVFNPTSGRIDFAVISTSTGASSSTSAVTTPTDTATSASSSSSGKLVAVPWPLIRTTSSSALSSSTSAGQQAFLFAGDTSKLQSAPSFDQSNWPDITQYTWRQSIYTHFGLTAGSATGGASSPGGADSSSGSSSTIPPAPSSSDNSSPKQQ